MQKKLSRERLLIVHEIGAHWRAAVQVRRVRGRLQVHFCSDNPQARGAQSVRTQVNKGRVNSESEKN